MNSGNITFLKIMVLFFLIIMSCNFLAGNEVMINCDAKVSLDFGSVVFKGNYLFYIKKNYTGSVYITGHAMYDGKKYDISRTFNIVMDPLSESDNIYCLTVKNNSFHANDMLYQKENTLSRRWILSNQTNIKDSFQVLRIQPFSHDGTLFLIGTLQTPIALCQAPQKR